MASQQGRRRRPAGAGRDGRAKTARTAPPRPRSRRPLVAGVLVAVATVAAAFVIGVAALGGSSSASTPTAPTAVSGTVVQARGGHWTNVTPATLAAMLTAKDFTLLNVKTPYIGEIEGTDLYIPYDQLTARAAELPADRTAKIVVYCRTGNESAIAAQTLLDLGYTNIWNLDGGMTAWVASGRSIVQKART